MEGTIKALGRHRCWPFWQRKLAFGDKKICKRCPHSTHITSVRSFAMASGPRHCLAAFSYWKLLKTIENYWKLLKTIENYWKLLKTVAEVLTQLWMVLLSAEFWAIHQRQAISIAAKGLPTPIPVTVAAVGPLQVVHDWSPHPVELFVYRAWTKTGLYLYIKNNYVKLLF